MDSLVSFLPKSDDERLFHVTSIPHKQLIIKDLTDNKTGKFLDNKKKIVHRDIERLRRQGMTALYTTLRTLLPLQYLKGKRSISEYVNGATFYIKHQERKIQELREKRDKMRKLFKLCTSTCDNVSVQRSSLGLDVVISSGTKEGVIPVSRVLEVLVAEGFGVLSCVSTRANGRLVHNIKCEVIDPLRVNVFGLQQTVMNLVQLGHLISV